MIDFKKKSIAGETKLFKLNKGGGVLRRSMCDISCTEPDIG